MKHIYYTLISGFVCISALVSPLDSRSQCSTCAGGTPSLTIEHTFILDTTLSSTNTVSFPKFPPSQGTLSCVTIYDTISLVALSGVRNRDTSAGGKDPIFQLTLSHSLTGPSLSLSGVASRVYGPVHLEKYGTPGDSTTFGPDTLFKNAPYQQTISGGVAGYMGSGNIDLPLDINGGMISIIGGTNYNLSLDTKIWGRFRIVYSYCPPAPLPEIFRQFTAVKQSNNNIQLNWSVSNDQISNSYEIEISSDGRNFTPAGKIASQYATEGASAKYNYQHLPDKDATGKLYFRIKQLSADGKGYYSAIRQVGINNSTPASFITYPNPVKDHVTIQSDRLLRGNYQLEMITSSGQQVMKHNVSLNNTSLIQWALPFQPAPGVYYLRTRELSTGQTASYKVLVSR